VASNRYPANDDGAGVVKIGGTAQPTSRPEPISPDAPRSRRIGAKIPRRRRQLRPQTERQKRRQYPLSLTCRTIESSHGESCESLLLLPEALWWVHGAGKGKGCRAKCPEEPPRLDAIDRTTPTDRANKLLHKKRATLQKRLAQPVGGRHCACKKQAMGNAL